MATKLSSQEVSKTTNIVAAIERTMGVIEFQPDGKIVRANDIFLKVVGYTLSEVQGRHHSMFLNPQDVARPEYQAFWTDLAAGKAQAGRFARQAKNGSTVWLEAAYTPILDDQGVVTSVIKFATDISEARRIAAANAGAIAAIERSMAVIEFEPDGTIVRANPLFLSAMGYTEDEIKGRHHRMFLRPEDAAAPEYADFWRLLSSGQVNAGRFERVAKGGQSVWLEATYNPILDPDGRTVRVTKFATNVTEAVESAQRVAENAQALELAAEKAREAERVREELDRTLQEMSTPVMPIWDEILLLPLVGVVDSARTDDVMRKSLTHISETRSKMFILDISGVPTVDTAVANQLLKITKATQLMGCETVISGLSPAIARTMVDLGIDVGQVRTTATLRDAFRASLSRVSSRSADPKLG